MMKLQRLLILAVLLSASGCADTITKEITLNNPDTDTSCKISGNTISCPDGNSITYQDTDTSCTIKDNVLSCPDGSSQELLTGATIVSIIRPCGDTQKFQEALFRLSTGQIIAVFDTDTKNSPQQTRLVTLVPGSYTTTDQKDASKKCKFKVLTNGEGVEVVEPGTEEYL